MAFLSLKAEYVSTQENVPCVLFPLPTFCVSFLLFAVHSLQLLFTLTHLLLKENGCAPGFQSAMEKDGTQRSPASSHSPLLQTNSRSQREAFLQEGKTHTHTEERRWAKEETPGHTEKLQWLFWPGLPRACGHPHSYSVTLSCGVMHMPDRGEGGSKGNNPQTVTKWLPPHWQNWVRGHISVYTIGSPKYLASTAPQV